MLGPEPVLVSATSSAAGIARAVRHAGLVFIIFGAVRPGEAALDARLAETVALFQQSALPAEVSTDLRRRMEVEALQGQPQAFAKAHGLPTPAIDVLLPLLRGLDRFIRSASRT